MGCSIVPESLVKVDLSNKSLSSLKQNLITGCEISLIHLVDGFPRSRFAQSVIRIIAKVAIKVIGG
jgi:hypothetical protein